MGEADAKAKGAKEKRGVINGQLWQNWHISAVKRGGNQLLLFLLALLIQQVQQASGLLADEVDTAHIVCVVDVVPCNSLCLVLLLDGTRQRRSVNKRIPEIDWGQNTDYIINKYILPELFNFLKACANELNAAIYSLTTYLNIFTINRTNTSPRSLGAEIN